MLRQDQEQGPSASSCQGTTQQRHGSAPVAAHPPQNTMKFLGGPRSPHQLGVNGKLHGRISIECFSMIAETSKIQDLYMRPSGL